MNGIMKSCNKRPVTAQQIQDLVDDIENTLMGSGEREVPSKQIGNMVMDRLKEVDEVAYVRFASVYRQFKDINTFIDELEKLLVEKKQG
jgi:transcriptional repressor NrdR